MNALRYIELKSGHHDNGPAWIGRVSLSRSRTTVYFNGHALKKFRGGSVSGNYYDLETGEEYWVSGVKKTGGDRHPSGTGRILIEADVVKEYLSIRGLSALDPKHYEVTDKIVETDIAKFKHMENHSELKHWLEENAYVSSEASVPECVASSKSREKPRARSKRMTSGGTR